MAEEKQITPTAIVIMLLVSLGVNVADSTLFENENALADYYICDVTNETGQFARLSSTKLTAYPYELDNVGRVRCKDAEGNSGEWQNILDYAKENNIDLGNLVPEDNEESTIPEEEHTGKQYKCGEECIEV